MVFFKVSFLPIAKPREEIRPPDTRLIVRRHAVRTHSAHDPALGFPPEVGSACRANPAAKIGARTRPAGQGHGILAAEPHLPNTPEYPGQTMGDPIAIVTPK